MGFVELQAIILSLYECVSVGIGEILSCLKKERENPASVWKYS